MLWKCILISRHIDSIFYHKYTSQHTIIKTNAVVYYVINKIYHIVCLHPLNDQLNLDVIPVKAFPHFSAICYNCRFVIFNCFLLIMLFALELLPLRTLMPTNTYVEGIYFSVHFCGRMYQNALILVCAWFKCN